MEKKNARFPEGFFQAGKLLKEYSSNSGSASLSGWAWAEMVPFGDHTKTDPEPQSLCVVQQSRHGLTQHALPYGWQGQSDLKISCHCFNEAGQRKPAVGGFYGEDASKKPELMNVNGPIPFYAIKQSIEARERRIPIERPCPVLPLAWWFLLWSLTRVQTEGQAMPLTLCLTCLFDYTKALHPHIQG